MTTVLAVIGDTHCGGTTALCPPIYELQEQGHQRANPIQLWLWKCWVDYWRRVQDTVKKNDAELIVILNGDLVEGVHHGTVQVVSQRPDDMMNIAISCIEPYIRSAKHVFVTRGTEAHVGAGGVWDDAIARDFDAEPDGSSPAWYWLPLEIDGVRIVASHHGRAGARLWTKGTGARALAAELAMQAGMNSSQPPQLGVFGHVHRFEDSGGNYPTWVYTHGCWQLSTGYGHKIRAGFPPEVGGLLFVIKDGSIITRDPAIKYVWRDREPWKFSSSLQMT